MVTAGNFAVTGCEAHLTHSMLLDLASISLGLLPPQGLFKKPHARTASADSSVRQKQGADDLSGRPAKAKLALQVTRVTVGVTSMVVGYQTAVQVAAADRRHEEDSVLMLTCTQCVTLQELTAEVHPLSYRGNLQMNNLAVTHQETQTSSTPAGPSSGTSAHLHHEIDMLRAAHLSVQTEALPVSHNTAADNPASGGQTDQGSESLGPPRLAVKISLNGWRTGFHSDAVIGVCKAAGDVSSVVRQTAASLNTISLELVEVNSQSAKVPVAGSSEAHGAATPPVKVDEGSRIMTKLSRLQKLPAVRLIVEIARWQTDIVVADHIVWGVRLAEVQLKVDSRTLLALQQQQLQAQLSQLSQQPRAQTAGEAHEAELADSFQPPEQRQQHSKGVNRGVKSADSMKELLAASERPSLVARVICLTLNRKALLQCGEIDGSLNLCPKRENQHSMSRAFSSSTSLGSPRRQASLGKTAFTHIGH